MAQSARGHLLPLAHQVPFPRLTAMLLAISGPPVLFSRHIPSSSPLPLPPHGTGPGHHPPRTVANSRAAHSYWKAALKI